MANINDTQSGMRPMAAANANVPEVKTTRTGMIVALIAGVVLLIIAIVVGLGGEMFNNAR